MSRWVARWLAHPTGILQALLITGVWFAAPFIGWQEHAAIFWYLAFCTFISFATQFTIAFQNQKAELALEQTLRNITDLMRLDVTLAERIEDALEALDESVDRLLALAANEETIQQAAVKQEEGLYAAVMGIQALLEARTEFFRKLTAPPVGEADAGT